MELSIIIPTINRDIELDQLLNSILKLNLRNYEIIIVDQNQDNRIDSIIKRHLKSLPIYHHKVTFKGLSKAKNYGTDNASGDFICFPDDDSEFSTDTVEIALKQLHNDKTIDILFGKTQDRGGNDSVIKFSNQSGFLNLSNFEGKFVEATMFARTMLLKEYRFDENLGAGTFFGAEEGYDLIYRLLKAKKSLYYDPKIKFYHPQTIIDKSDYSSLMRVYSYRKGFSYACLKHKMYIRLFSRIILVSSGVVLFLPFNRSKSYFYLVEFCSLITGILFSRKILS